MLSCQLLVDEVNCFLETKDEIVKIILIVDKSKRAAASLGELSDQYRAGRTASRPSPYLVVGLASSYK